MFNLVRHRFSMIHLRVQYETPSHKKPICLKSCTFVSTFFTTSAITITPNYARKNCVNSMPTVHTPTGFSFDMFPSSPILHLFGVVTAVATGSVRIVERRRCYFRGINSFLRSEGYAFHGQFFTDTIQCFFEMFQLFIGTHSSSLRCFSCSHRPIFSAAFCIVMTWCNNSPTFSSIFFTSPEFTI